MSKNDDYKQGVVMFNVWQKDIKNLEKKGMYGTDYYITKVGKLEKQVKELKKKLRDKNKKNA